MSGDVDYRTVPEVREQVLADRPEAAVIDLLGVGFFDSPGLALLVEGARVCRGHTLLRIVADGAALRAIQITGLDDVLELYPTRAPVSRPAAGWSRRKRHG